MGISERELEDWIVQNWEETPWGQLYETLIGRQIWLKHGRCDLLAFHSHPHLIELKARRIKEKDIGQILRYRHDLSKVLNALCLDNPYGRIECDDEYERQEFLRAWRIACQLPPSVDELHAKPSFQLTLVGTGIDDKTLASADGAMIDVCLWHESENGMAFETPVRDWRSDQRWAYEHGGDWMKRLSDAVICFCMNHVYAQRYSVLHPLFGSEDVDVDLSISPVWVDRD